MPEPINAPQTNAQRPITIAMLALGGQGGGVLTNWLVQVGESNDYLVQSTYVAGVAQRTGATVYCVELFPKAQMEAAGKAPVLALYPVPGDVDIAIASELAETGRAIQKGFVTPDRTTLIASSHRVYSIVEKSALDDGIVDQSQVLAAAAKAAKSFVCFDMNAAAEQTGSVISAIILGAIAGAGVLPFAREDYEAAIREAGRAVPQNLAGFATGFERARSAAQQSNDVPSTVAPERDAPAPSGPNGQALAARITEQLPHQCQALALHGALRALEYQDRAYAELYLDRLQALMALDREHGGEQYNWRLTQASLAPLALQMCYEDTIRVGQIKTSAKRLSQIRRDLNAQPGQPAYVSEYFHPRYEELCDTLPARLGAALLNSSTWRRLLAPAFEHGRQVQTNKLSGFALLHFLSSLRRWRRSTYRYQVQQAHIEQWLAAVTSAVPQSYDYAVALADSIRLVSGYGDTYERGLHRYQRTLQAAATVEAAQRAELVRKLQQAALADEAGAAFEHALGELAS